MDEDRITRYYDRKDARRKATVKAGCINRRHRQDRGQSK